MEIYLYKSYICANIILEENWLQTEGLMKKRQKDILNALKEFGGKATTRQIALKTGLNVNGVAQSLGALDGVEYIEGKGGDAEWKMR